ncbi:MAG: hypothetical protein A4E48_00228 [Methanosaeta sp. PtaU1.Bin060]|nr:MAG: hypothetical protein A4E48_00228 [Methanosaeta sp. PtaU1.Bin060]
MTMDYASSIPAHFNESFARDVLNYRSRERDKMIARNLSTIRNVGPTVQKDTITFYEKTGGNDTIAAKITAKGDVPEQVGMKGNELTHSMYQISVGFMINGRDLTLDPAIQRRKIEIATAEIRRREDYIWINGDTETGLTGLVTASANNPNGKVVAYGSSSSSPNVDSKGNWAGTDTFVDIYTDVLEACDRIGEDFEPKFLCGTRATIAPIRKMDDLRNRYADQILDLFGAASTADFIRTSKYFPAGYAFVVAQDMEFMEFVISEDLVVDTSFPKEPGDNYRVELREWVNPVEFHSNEGVAEIYTL